MPRMTFDDLFLFAGFTQPLTPELANGLKHEIALTPVHHGELNQRSSDQLGQQVNDFVLLDAIAGTDLTGRLTGPTAGENRKAAKKYLFLFGEQTVAPINRTLECSMANVMTASSLEQSKAIRHYVNDLIDCVSADLHGGKLDCERDAFKQPAQLSDKRQIFDLKIGAVLFREYEEKLNGIGLPRLICSV